MTISNYGSDDEVRYFPGYKSECELTNSDDICSLFVKIEESVKKRFDIDEPDRNKLNKSLAFILEASNQLGDRICIELLRDFQTHLDDFSNPMSKQDVLWIISQLVDNLYEKTLAFHILHEQKLGNSQKIQSLNQSLRMYKMIEKMNAKSHEKGRDFALGGIREDFIPHWYLRKFDTK